MFTGPIQRQLRDALSYIENCVIASKTYKLDDAAEARVVYNYPFRAVEEILSNAVYHRSYQVAEPICVRITPQALEVTSYPGFDRSITDADVAAHRFRARIYRNRRIGDFLKELRLIEGRNTGFPNAFEALRQNGSADPAFEMDDNRGYLSVTIPVHQAFLPSGRTAAKAGAYEGRILGALEGGPLSLTELATAMGYKGISKKLSSAVTSMLQRGLLEHVVGEGGKAKLARVR